MGDEKKRKEKSIERKAVASKGVIGSFCFFPSASFCDDTGKEKEKKRNKKRTPSLILLSFISAKARAHAHTEPIAKGETHTHTEWIDVVCS